MQYKKRSLLCACPQGGFSIITNIHELRISDFENLLRENLQKSATIMSFDLYKKLLKKHFLKENDITIVITKEAIDVDQTKGNTFIAKNLWDALNIAEGGNEEQILFLYDEELLFLALKNIAFQTLQICLIQGKTREEFSLTKPLPLVHLSDYSHQDTLYKISKTNAYGFFMRTYTLEP